MRASGSRGRALARASVELGHSAPDAEHETIQVLTTDSRGVLNSSLPAGTLRLVAWIDRSTSETLFVELVPGTILRLLVEDMPVRVLWRRPSLTGEALLRPLRDLADRLIVNSARFDAPIEQPRELKEVAFEPAWKGHPADLTWARLEPWREALASFFDGPMMRSHLERLTRVAVSAGGPASGLPLTESLCCPGLGQLRPPRERAEMTVAAASPRPVVDFS